MLFFKTKIGFLVTNIALFLTETILPTRYASHLPLHKGGFQTTFGTKR